MAHLLVTGGAGYVGSHGLRALLRAGHTAVVVDDLRRGWRDLAGGAPLAEIDMGDRAALEQVFAERGPFDGVLHFAAYALVGESVADPMAYYRNNTVASATLIETALAHGANAFVLSSSAAVYGEPRQQPIPESTPRAPVNPYGASKAMVERMLEDTGSALGLRWMALRYFNACGADPEGGIGERHEPETHLIPNALGAAAGARDAFRLFGTDYDTPDGTCIRDYIHVTDLGDAHVRAIEALLGGHPSGAYNLGTGAGHSNREVLAAVEKGVGRAVPVVEAPRRAGDPPVLIADASRFQREFDWHPRYSDLETIVATAWEWFSNPG